MMGAECVDTRPAAAQVPPTRAAGVKMGALWMEKPTISHHLPTEDSERERHDRRTAEERRPGDVRRECNMPLSRRKQAWGGRERYLLWE